MKYLQKVKCKAKLKRIHGESLHPNQWHTSKRYWGRLKDEFEGHIIGTRTLSDGTVTYDPEGVIFDSDKYFKVYLVSVNMNENPVYVLPEDIEK